MSDGQLYAVNSSGEIVLIDSPAAKSISVLHNVDESAVYEILLVKAVRAATLETVITPRYWSKGFNLFIDIDIRPAAETFIPIIQAYEPVNDSYFNWYVAGALGAAGVFNYQIYPGAVETLNQANGWVQGMRAPPIWRLRLQHSGAGDWTYGVSIHWLH